MYGLESNDELSRWLEMIGAEIVVSDSWDRPTQESTGGTLTDFLEDSFT